VLPLGGTACAGGGGPKGGGGGGGRLRLESGTGGSGGGRGERRRGGGVCALVSASTMLMSTNDHAQRIISFYSLQPAPVLLSLPAKYGASRQQAVSSEVLQCVEWV
jgi:hypothetical protein